MYAYSMSIFIEQFVCMNLPGDLAAAKTHSLSPERFCLIDTTSKDGKDAFAVGVDCARIGAPFTKPSCTGPAIDARPIAAKSNFVHGPSFCVDG